MRFLGWAFTLLVFTFAVGFFIDWFDVSKKDGTVSFQVNTRTIGVDLRSTGNSLKSVVTHLGNP